MNESAPAASLSCNLEMTLRQWTERYQQEIVTQQVRYRGVPAWKNVLDLWIVQEIIHDSQPDFVIEIGCKFGGTTLWLSDAMKTVARGQVISVDLKPPSISVPENVHFVQGDSIAKQTVATISALTHGKRAMVIADGNHAADHVLEELRLYGPLVALGCYFIAEDGIVDVMEWEEFTPGPLRAVQRFLRESSDFEIDSAREKFLLTYAPHGFLKRVR